MAQNFAKRCRVIPVQIIVNRDLTKSDKTNIYRFVCSLTNHRHFAEIKTPAPEGRCSQHFVKPAKPCGSRCARPSGTPRLCDCQASMTRMTHVRAARNSDRSPRSRTRKGARIVGLQPTVIASRAPHLLLVHLTRRLRTLRARLVAAREGLWLE